MDLIHLPHLTCVMGLASVTFSETWNEDHILIVYVLEKDKKVKFTLEQATKAQRGNRDIALLSLTSVLDGRCVVNAKPPPLYPWERPSTHCIKGWMGPRAGLDRCRKCRPLRDSIPGLSSP